MTRTTLNLMSCLVLMTAQAAFAEDETEELVEKVAVRNRLFSVEGRWELGGNVGFSLLSRLTDHYNFNVSVAFNPKDWLGLELRGGYALSRHTSLADQIQTDFFANNTISRANDAADLWELTAHGVFGIRFQPIYGKINLMSELPIHFQFYVWAGGGVGALKRESMVLCAERVSARECGQFLTENKVSPLVSVALGFRFFIMQQHSVKIEVRDWSYLDSFQINVDRATGTGGMDSPNAGITNLVQFDLGYAFIF
ncbi:MAG: outer membrane beta-barrel domain-containing protein [Archangium sp.]|nr:outer membrane beta-barrel domain-containing protein [Archangium sp.]MDP3568999.1 outer membrane beta-barrel domain-containing protein [Archangium sp.]